MRITGKRFYFSLNEQLELLRESQESKSQSAAKKLVMQRLGYDEQEADEFVRLKLRNDLPALKKSTAAKFTLAATRMFLDRQLTDAQAIGDLNTALAYAANEKHYNEFDRNLNGLSAQDFINMMRPEIEADNKKKQEEVNNTQYTQNNDYDIVRIDSFEQAEQYGNYTSWCITFDEESFDDYTANGINQFYFCLRKGFESVPKEKGENCPLDEYGLSMVAVSVNSMGGLNTCDCRWNHDNGGNDNIMDERQISQLVGRNFYSTFKPSEKGAGQRRLILSVQKQANLSDEDARKIKLWPNDDGNYIVKLDGKWNILTKDGKLLFPNQWLDYIEPYSDGTYKVRLDGKWNILTKDDKFLFPNQWFEEIYRYSNGTYTLKLNGKQNILTREGKLLSPNQWFDEMLYRSYGTYEVKLNGKYNILTKDGKLLFPNQWLDYIKPYDDGTCEVNLNRKWNILTREGKLLSPNQWFDEIYSNDDGTYSVESGGKWNILTQDGKLLSPNQWFYDVEPNADGTYSVELGRKWNILTKDGKFMFPNQWPDFIKPNYDGTYTVELNGKQNILTRDGKLKPEE